MNNTTKLTEEELTRQIYEAMQLPYLSERHDAIKQLKAQWECEARLGERKQVAFDNYRGQTFSDATNYKGKFEKFVENNERRIAALQSKKQGGEKKYE